VVANGRIGLTLQVRVQAMRRAECKRRRGFGAAYKILGFCLQHPWQGSRVDHCWLRHRAGETSHQ
jgi:hypothetical protein